MARFRLVVVLLSLLIVSSSIFAAKPVRNEPEPAVAAPEVYSVKIDYNNGIVIVSGQNLSPGTASGTVPVPSVAKRGETRTTTAPTPAAASAVEDVRKARFYRKFLPRRPSQYPNFRRFALEIPVMAIAAGVFSTNFSTGPLEFSRTTVFP